MEQVTQDEDALGVGLAEDCFEACEVVAEDAGWDRDAGAGERFGLSQVEVGDDEGFAARPDQRGLRGEREALAGERDVDGG